MSALGPCPDCGEALGADQRYCADCGHRIEAPLAPTYFPVGPTEEVAARPAAWPFPIPVSTAGIFVAMALAFGVVMGTAVSPNLSELIASGKLDSVLGAAAPTPIVPSPAPTTDKGGGSKPKPSDAGGGSSSSPDFNSGSGFYGSTGSYGSSGSGGVGSDTGKNKPEKKPKPTYLAGTVLHQNTFAVSYSISSGGGISAIHTKDPSTLPAPGTKVKVPIRRLANGTYAEDGKRQVQGSAGFVKFQGTVTDSRAGIGVGEPDVYTVSARGASVMIYVADGGATPTPAVGSLVTTTAEIKPKAPQILPPPNVLGSCGTTAPLPTPFPATPSNPEQQLWQTAVSTTTTVEAAQIETLVQKSCATPSPGSVVVSSDDTRAGNSDIELIAAGGTNPGSLVQGNVISATVTISGGVVTEVTGTVSDQGINGASGRASAQGKFFRASRASNRRVERAFLRAARRAPRR